MTGNELVTPCYILHKQLLDDGLKLLRDSLEKYWNNYEIGYSFKTNSLPWVVAYMQENGISAEVVSKDEYLLAKKFQFAKIIYNGPVKEKNTFLEAATNGNVINIDSKREIEWLMDAFSKDDQISVGVRVNFNIEEMCPGESSAGDEGGRFGFSLENGDFKKVIDRLQQHGIKVAGIHLHTSSKTRSVKIYECLAMKACEIAEQYQLDLEYIDLGGGYFGGMDNKPKFPQYMEAVSNILRDTFSPQHTKLIVEPGTSIITPPIDYVTTVVDCKDTYANRIVVTDGSRIDIDPLHGKTSYFYDYIPKNEEEHAEIEKQVICGFTCMENDRIMTLKDQKEILEGDQLVFHKVGGYTMCLTPLFIRYFPNVYLEDNGEYRCIRKAWNAKQYCGE